MWLSEGGSMGDAVEHDLEEIAEQVGELKEKITVIDEEISMSKSRMSRLAALFEEAQNTTDQIIKTIYELKMEITEVEKRTENGNNVSAINKQNIRLLGEHVKKLSKMFKDMSDEISCLKEEVETNSWHWKRLLGILGFIGSTIVGIVYFVHEYCGGWVNLLKSLLANME